MVKKRKNLYTVEEEDLVAKLKLYNFAIIRTYHIVVSESL